MNCKKLIKGTIVAVVTALFFAGAPLWAGQILVDVNDPACVSGTGQPDPYSVVYCNIQDAVTDATAGDVINVAAGTYAGLTVATANIEVRGAQYNVDPAGALSRGTGDVDESMITSTIMITADDVTVNGFKTGYPINVGYNRAWYVNISYNISLNADGHWGAIHLHGTATGPVYNQCDFAYIGYNTISGTTSPDWQGGGIWTVGNDDVTIEHNHILNSQYMGIIALNHVGDRNQILHNTITGSGHTPIKFWGGSQVDISYNVVDGGGSDGIWVDQAADNSTVSYNQISNVTYAAVALRAGATGVNVHHNTITASGTGVEKHDDDITGITVNYNDIYGNSAGFGGGCSAAIDVRYNYWGGGGIGAPGEGGNNSCNATADYSPWLGSQVGTSPMTWGTDDSIQDAIDVASAGDVINVAAGTYVENVVIAKSLDLIGASSATTIIDGNNIGNTVTITASNVTLSGFKVTGGWANGLDVFHPVGGVVVDGNSGDTSLTGITIEDNIIDGNLGNGVYVSAAGHGGGASNVVIKDCQISNNGGSNAGISLTYPNYIIRPVGVWDEWKRPKNILVQGNTIYSNSEYGVYISAGENNVIRSNEIYNNSKYGLQLASSWNRTDIPCEYTAIEDNDIHDNVRNGVKLTSYNQYNTFTGNTIYNNGSGGTSDYYKYGFLFQDGNDNTIENNTITGNAVGGLYLWGKGDPSYTWYSTTNNTITGNTISNHTAVGGKGIYIPANYGNPNSGFLNHHIYANILICNTINGEDDGAISNWDDGVTTGNFWDDWASNLGYPTQYNVPGTAGSADNYPQAPSVVWVDDDWAGTPCGDSVGGHLFGYDAFDKIQDGVNAVVVNGTVNVLAGTYEEQVVIDKLNLTIAGAGAGDNPSINTIVKSPVTLTWFFTTSANNYPIVGINGVTGVAIQNLRVDGAGRGNSNYRFVGIGFWNGDGSVTDCEITGVRDTPFSGAQHGNGIYSYNNTGGPYTINVTGTSIDDFQKNGMTLAGNNLTTNITNCIVKGYGLTDVIAQNGIQISHGAGGTVTDCSISDIGYTPAISWIASGMLFLNGTSVVVSGTNSITGSQASMVFQETQGSVYGITISSADIDAAEGISIRDYGYYRTRMDEGSMRAVPISPLEEEWQIESKSAGTSTSVTINDATITGIHHSGSYGVAAWSLGENVNVTLNNSEIQDWEIGIVAYESGSQVSLTANSNNISNNDMGFWTNASSLQNAEANWWGDVLGPYHPTTNPNATGNEVADNVDYSPWWGADYVNDPHSSAWTWFLNTSNNSTIQEGIDLATSGDMVRPRPGTYNENIVANKSIALLGAGQDSVLVYPAISDIGQPNPEAGPSFRGSQMCVVQATDVTIEGFTFDGDSPTLTSLGTLDARNGIITNYYTGDWSNLKVQNCTVRNIYLRGIYASAQTPNNLTGVDLNHNTVSNVKGVSMQSAGIMLWGSSGNAKHNNVSDASLGIFYHWYSDGSIDSNNVTTSEVCLGVNSNDATTSISHNTITNSPQGIQTVSTLAPVNITSNSVTACTSGVVLYGGGTGQVNVWDNNIEGLGYYSTYGVWGSTDLTPWGLGDLSANLKRNTIKNNFYGIVLNEPSSDRSKSLSVLIGGASADHNFIYNNLNLELLLEYCNDDQTATYNYWGKSLYAQIEDEIYHQVDQPDLGLVNFDPAILHGDVNLDGQISIADVVYLINYLFKGGPAPQLIIVADINRDGNLSVSDAVYLINYLFKGGPAPKELISETIKPVIEKPTVEKQKLTRPIYLHSVEK